VVPSRRDLAAFGGLEGRKHDLKKRKRALKNNLRNPMKEPAPSNGGPYAIKETSPRRDGPGRRGLWRGKAAVGGEAVVRGLFGRRLISENL